jgi:prepilin-type N-terminal cleavage/methylation domain-containing protein
MKTMKQSSAIARLGWSHARAGFSLIEFIAVLAIISILALSLIGVVVKRVDIAAYSAEQTALSSITNALLQQVYLNKSVPCSTNWAQSAANWLNLPVSQIQTNARNYARAYCVDTNGWLGGNTNYIQTTNGTTVPNNARVLIISSIGSALPVSSGPLTPTAFNNIWNTTYPQKPSLWTLWNGRGEDLVIQRLTYTPCFKRLILVNHFDNSGAFTIDAYSSPVNLTSASYFTNGWDAYYITGTSLGICSNNIAANANTVQMKVVMNDDLSYVYESPGTWLGTIANGSVGSSASAFANLAQSFLGSGVMPNNAQNSKFYVGSPASPQGSPQDVMAAMECLMSYYTTWANTTPAFSSTYAHSMGDLALSNVINNGIILDGGIAGPGILY